MLFLPAKRVERDLSFHGDTLIVPVVSTGNVGQLAVDLFLSSGRVQSPALVEKVGYLETDRVAPAAGYEVFGPGQPPVLCVSLELHRFAKSGVTFLQQRGTVLPGEERSFAAELVEWARESGFKDVLALTGADAAEGLDPTPIGRGAMKRYRAGTSVAALAPHSPEPCPLEEALSRVGIGAFDVAGVMQGGWRNLMAAPMGGGALDAPGGAAAGGVGLGAGGAGEEEGEEELALATAMVGNEQAAMPPTLPPLPSGTGVAGFLCTEASSTRTVADGETKGPTPPLIVLLRFCGEGDNTPEAIEMAQAVNASLKLLPGGGDGEGAAEVRWSSPLSWASLYGLPPAADAYQ